MFENCFFSHHLLFTVFDGATSFNGDLSTWQTGAVTDMADSKL